MQGQKGNLKKPFAIIYGWFVKGCEGTFYTILTTGLNSDFSE